MEKDKVLKECVSYFRTRPVYQKVFRKVREKYAGLGRLGGVVQLTGLNREEKEQLGGFFQKDYTANKTVTISLQFMEKHLASSKFSGLSWEEILEAYFGEPLEVRKEAKRQRQQERERYFAEQIKIFPPGDGRDWVEDVLKEQTDGYGLLMQLYKESPERLLTHLTILARGIAELETMKKIGKKELFPVFAAKITGNPHAFDQGEPEEKLLFYYVQSRYGKKEWKALAKTEYKSRVYFEAGLLKDEVSNDVLAYGVHGQRTDGGLHQGLEGFWKQREPVKLTLQTLGGLTNVWGQGTVVYIVENPAIFSALVREHPDWTVICGNGQLRLAVLVLLERFPKTALFRYAGDFDPEGLLIAQRLKLRYRERLQLWNYHVSWYKAHRSDVKLTESRMRKLEQVQIEELQEMKEAMLRERKAAYQEAMLEEIVGG